MSAKVIEKNKAADGLDAHFPTFSKAVHAKFQELSAGELYVTSAGDELFAKYMAAFPAGTNPVVRTRELHNCLLPGARVQGRVEEASKAWYAGEAVELVTRGGQRLSLTVNHPVLTTSGFVQAGNLTPGHHLIQYEGHPRLPDLPRHNEHPPTLIEEVFESFEVAAAMRFVKASTRLDLYGDGESIQGEIHVVRPDRRLWRHPYAGRAQRINHRQVARTGVGHLGVADERPRHLDRHAVLLAPACGVGAGGEGLPLFRGHDLVPHGHDVARVSTRNTGVLQLAHNGVRADTEIVSYAARGLSRGVPAQNLLGAFWGEESQPTRFGSGAELDVRRYQPAADGGRRETNLAADLVKRFPSTVAVDDVVQVRRFHYAGPVYDLGTDVGYFVASTNSVHGGIVVANCNTCRSFIRRLGKLVGIKDGKVVTVWSDLDLPQPYKGVADALDAAVKQAQVLTVFRTKERKFGTEYNYDTATNERHDHFWGDVADLHFSPDPETKRGEKDAIFQVMRRGLIEVKESDLVQVLDLIDSNGLYRGAEHRAAVAGFLDLYRDFWKTGGDDLYVWEHLDNRNARFRNTAIGTLFTDLADGKTLDDAVKAFEAKVAPANYKRPTAVITQKMVDDALKTLNELDLGGAVHRRFARLSDVSVNDVLFVDNEARGKMKDGLALLLEGSVKKAAPNLDRTVAIAADDFVKDVLPGAKTLDVVVQNRHLGNFVSLTGGDGPERLFKWNNNFAWSYDGDVTDSVKQRVKAAGGKIDCALRVSLSWFNFDDLDLHAHTPDGKHIYYRDKLGILDVDMNAGMGATRDAVENLAFNNLKDGVYRIVVNQYHRRETIDVGFAIEVEFGGQIQQYSYPKSLTTGENVECFELHVKKGQLEKIETALTGGTVSKEKWGVKTETAVPVVAAMYSPNWWADQKVGAKHLIFALKGCKNPDPVRTIFNEYLRADLEKHRKVFETLGAKTKAQPTDDQISGVGFTAARGDSVTVVVDGKRAYTLTF